MADDELPVDKMPWLKGKRTGRPLGAKKKHKLPHTCLTPELRWILSNMEANPEHFVHCGMPGPMTLELLKWAQAKKENKDWLVREIMRIHLLACKLHVDGEISKPPDKTAKKKKLPEPAPRTGVLALVDEALKAAQEQE